MSEISDKEFHEGHEPEEDPAMWISTAGRDRVEFAELVELEEATRHTTRWESVNSLGFTEPEIRIQAASIAATAVASLMALNPETTTAEVATRIILVAAELEQYLRTGER